MSAAHVRRPKSIGRSGEDRQSLEHPARLRQLSAPFKATGAESARKRRREIYFWFCAFSAVLMRLTISGGAEIGLTITNPEHQDRLEGIADVRFAIERLDLVDGTYKLDVAVHKRDGFPYDYHRLLYTFRVKSRTHDVGIYQIGRAHV